MDVGAVRDRVRVAEAACETRIEQDIDHLLGAHAVEHEQVLDEHRFLLSPGRRRRAHRARAKRWRDLDPSPDFAEQARLLEHDRAEALAGERERRREPADPPPATMTGFSFFAFIAAC